MNASRAKTFLNSAVLGTAILLSTAFHVAADGPLPLSPECECLLNGGEVNLVQLVPEEIFELPGPVSNYFRVKDLNNSGQILVSMRLPGMSQLRGFVWDDGEFINLPTPPSPSQCSIPFNRAIGLSINDSGTIAGYAIWQGSNGGAPAFWSSIESPGSVHYAPHQTPGSDCPAGGKYHAISNSGILAGHRGAGPYGKPIRHNSGGNMYEELPDVCHMNSRISAVNSSGLSAGRTGSAEHTCPGRAAKWGPDGTLTALLSPSSYATAVNEAGQIVMTRNAHTWMHYKSSNVYLGQFYSEDINNSGIVVGRNPATIWYQGETRSPQTFLEGLWLEQVFRVNDHCWMIGLGTLEGGPYQPFLLIPHADCDSTTPGDLNGDGVVNVSDLLILLSAWGECDDPEDCPADINGDGQVNVSDLLILLSNWG